jgi:single-strand DNA-binding protein
MNNLNSILIEGNLVNEPVLKTTVKGTMVCVFSIASNRFFKRENSVVQEVSYFDIQTWARLAETCGAEGRKGRPVRIVGRLKQERWNDVAGQEHAKVLIVAEHVEWRPESA